MIGWEYPPHNSGGLGVACQGLTEALAEQNTNINFTLPYDLGGNLSHMQVTSCTDPSWFTDQHDHNNPPFLAYSPFLTRLNSKLPLDPAKLAALPQSDLEHKVDQYSNLVADAAGKQKQFDLIHAHDWMSMPAASKVKQQTGKPMLAHIHSTELDRIPGGGGSDYIIKTEYEGMMNADKVIAVSYYTKKLLIDKYQIPENKIEVVHNGMNESLTRPDPGRHHFGGDRPIVVFMGRLTGQKGPYQFLELAEKLVKQIPDVLFVIAGDGDMYHQLLFYTAQKKLSTSVLFAGFVRDKQREQLLDRADVFVMPSLSEPFGLVAMEAAERHTPVIVSNNSGVKEVLTSAIATDFWDIDGMVAEISKLVRNSDYHQQVNQAQLKEVKNNTWDKAAEKVERVYRQAFLGR